MSDKEIERTEQEQEEIEDAGVDGVPIVSDPVDDQAIETGRAKGVSAVQDFSERAARRQSTKVKEFTPVMSGEYNIWYHRYSGYQVRETRRDRGTLTRCVVARDAGRTAAAADAPICLHFALGDCVRGKDCLYRHVLPTDADEKRAGIAHDVFGRERHKTDREDMGGVGSFSRNNRTLYVCGLKPDIPPEVYDETFRRHFGEWGDLEYVRVFPTRGFGFVRFRLRTAAEFAKVAMADQPLDNDETIDVRWAREDPNPIARAHEEQATTAQFVNAVGKTLSSLTPEERARRLAIQQAQALAANPAAYPNTDAQYPGAQKRPAAPTVGGGGIAPAVAYKFVFAGKRARGPGGTAPAAEVINPQRAGAFVANPDTGELHPYARGMFRPRQVQELRPETLGEREERVQAISNFYEHAYDSGQQSVTPQNQAPQNPSFDINDPAFFNDSPLV